jgi:Saxitoxin biosynthesis operon protein SxtJ
MNPADPHHSMNQGQRLDRARDTGMALTLLSLIVLWVRDLQWWFLPIGLLVLTMTVPKLFHFPALVWFAVAERLSWLMTRVILTSLYVLILLPVALLRRLAGKDPMQLRRWKEGSVSVFVTRDDTWTPAQLERPY